MAWTRRRLGVLACVVGGVILAIGIGVATGAKLKTTSASETLPADEFDSVTAKCKKGTKAVAGGFQSDSNPDDPGSAAILPFMSRADGGRKWTSAGLNVGSAGELTSFAYCRDQKIKRRTNETTLAGAETETVTARCPRGTKVASGGFDNPDFNVNGNTTAILPSVSKKVGKREWTVTGTNLGDTAGDLVAQVNCHERKGLKTVKKELSIDEPGVHDVRAYCGAGQDVSGLLAVSGGFDYSLEASEGAFVFASRKVHKHPPRDVDRGWEVEAVDFEATPATLTAFAYCEKRKAK
jgi:hypothetical protein